MSKILDFYKTNRYAILWTIAYFSMVWFILMFMFGFNIFILHNWVLLSRAEITGFAGFVFCILLLATMPMYMATTAIIMRTKKPLLTINMTKIFAPIITAMTPRPMPSRVTDTAPVDTKSDDTPATADKKPTTPEFPDTMPTEVRNAFIRARQHLETQIPAQYGPKSNTATPTPAPVPVATPEISDMGDIPLPPDFDFEPESDFTSDTSAPVFTDISFGDDAPDDDNPGDDDTSMDKATNTGIVDFEPNIPPISDTNNTPTDVIAQLTSLGRPARASGDLIISKNLIIATHNDPEFWIADPETWFAAGRQKPSPIIELIKESAKTGCKPVFYLMETNIMDLDNCRTTWEHMGITVITDLSQLPE